MPAEYLNVGVRIYSIQMVETDMVSSRLFNEAVCRKS